MFTSAAAHKHDWRTGERRSCHREPLQRAVLVFFGDNWGKLIDLSERGMSFQFAHAPALHEPITFTFEVMGSVPPHHGKVHGDSVQATGQVVWAQEFERTAGVQFLELSTRSRDQIRLWMSLAPGKEAAPATSEPEEELTEEWSREWNNQKNREAAAAPTPFAVEERLSPFTEAPDESLNETSEGELEDFASEPEPTFAPSSLDPDPLDAQLPQEPEFDFESRKSDHPADDMDRPGRTRSAFGRLGHAASAPDTEGLWEAKPESASRDDFADDPRDLWQAASAPAVEKVERFGFDVPPGFLEHEERQRRGQTLVLRQRRARVGYLAVLSFLASVGAVAAIIEFISKFSERPEAAASTSHPFLSQAEERGLAESATPFLVEVLDANQRRSVLWFSSEAAKNAAAQVGENAQISAIPATLAGAKPAPREESVSTETKQTEPMHDFSLGAPHASAPATSDSPQGSTALVEPALPGSVPVPADSPLQALSSPNIPAPVEQALPKGGDVQPARLVRAAAPLYPRLAKSLHVAGDVTLDALIDESGDVRDVKVLDGDVLLREAAKQAIRQWKYEPARLDGRPTAMHLTVTIKFHSDQASHQ